jgi:hypothetical protein
MRPFIYMLTIALLAGCGSEDRPKPAPPAQPQEAVSRIGDTTVRANVIRTALLNEAVARSYGIARAENTVLLLVGVRKGAEAQEKAVPATITANVSHLIGAPQALTLREQRAGEWIDYVATFEVSPPDTLRFDLNIAVEGGVRSNMQFTRDFTAK